MIMNEPWALSKITNSHQNYRKTKIEIVWKIIINRKNAKLNSNNSKTKIQTTEDKGSSVGAGSWKSLGLAILTMGRG